MNNGERDELICKLMLVFIRDSEGTLFGKRILSVGFLGVEYLPLPLGFDIENLKGASEEQLVRVAKSIGIRKASAREKSDIYINHVGVSLKSKSASPPALVNHTARPGFEFACQQVGVPISPLDDIIDEYWRLRKTGVIHEDTRIVDENCPFSEHKEYLRPLLEYFIFTGTGSRVCDSFAQYIIEFDDPFDFSTYKKLSKRDAVDALWDKLIFSVRAKKGMPKDYDPETYNKENAESILKWVSLQSGNYRGALHIRVSR